MSTSLEVKTRCPLKHTFSSILVSFWSSLRVSELPEIGEGLMDSDGVQLSPPASLISSSVAFRTFSTSVVMLHSEAAVYFCFRRTQAHTKNSATSYTLIWKKLQNVLCLANGTMQTEGKRILVCVSIAVMKLINKLKRGYDVPGFLAWKRIKTLKGESKSNTLVRLWLTKGWSHSLMHESLISDFTSKKRESPLRGQALL